MSTTANLGMTLPAGTDWADIAVLNANFELIDAAMEAARAAEPYSAAKTYAVGDYCTKNGTLFKCTVAITAPEVWTVGHWTATSVAAELLAIIAALSNKVNKATTGIASAAEIADSGFYLHAPAQQNVQGDYGSMVAIKFNDATGAYLDIALDGTPYVGAKKNGTWGAPKQLATATPPMLNDLPLEAGWTARNISKYWKDQFGQVSLVFRIGKITPPTTQGTVGYLPVGYRPTHPVHAAATMYPAYAAAVLAIGTDGSIILFSNGSDNSTEGSFCGAVSFVAGN